MKKESITTLRGTPVEEVRRQQAAQPFGQHDDYIILSDEERAKGFVRPVRRSYRHVGPPGPRFPLRDPSPEEASSRYAKYVKFEDYPESERPLVGRAWTQGQLDAVGKGCGSVTTMGSKLAETYARQPGFYGSTFCVVCNKHLPVGRDGEFVWEGTDERVGT